MNPNMDVIGLEHKVSSETRHIFDDDFWEVRIWCSVFTLAQNLNRGVSQSIDVVITGLDNVEARLFVDAQCVRHHKPMLDSGTLGTKGNVQVQMPKYECNEMNS
jgi:molybdopterin/thiamine biosynthesis adenylyltransferase